MLAAGFTLLAVTLLVSLGTGSLATAAAGDPLVLGSANSSTLTTYLNWKSDAPAAPNSSLVVRGSDNGAIFSTADYLLEADPAGGTGVAGYGFDTGGLFSGVDSGAIAKGWYVGLDAVATESDGVAVQASGNQAIAARGQAVGVHASGETAIQAEGAVSFSTAGLAKIPKGSTKVTLAANTDVTKSSKVLATVQSRGGRLLRVSRDSEADTITIYLTAPATQRVAVAYFVLQ